MLAYVIKRFLYMIPVLLAVLLVVSFLMYICPGDPTITILGENANVEEREALRESLGLNDPFFVQFWDYLTGLFRGDMGESYVNGEDIFQEILSRFPITIKLNIKHF